MHCALQACAWLAATALETLLVVGVSWPNPLVHARADEPCAMSNGADTDQTGYAVLGVILTTCTVATTPLLTWAFFHRALHEGVFTSFVALQVWTFTMASLLVGIYVCDGVWNVFSVGLGSLYVFPPWLIGACALHVAVGCCCTRGTRGYG